MNKDEAAEVLAKTLFGVKKLSVFLNLGVEPNGVEQMEEAIRSFFPEIGEHYFKGE